MAFRAAPLGSEKIRKRLGKVLGHNRPSAKRKNSMEDPGTCHFEGPVRPVTCIVWWLDSGEGEGERGVKEIVFSVEELEVY